MLATIVAGLQSGENEAVPSANKPDFFSGRHAVVFGGAKGIGAALASEVARRGARVCVCDIDVPAAEATGAAIRNGGHAACAMQVDVTDEGSIAEALGRARAEFGTEDIVVNNVGAIVNGRPEDMPGTEWERIHDLNFGAVLRGVRAVLPGMIARGSGCIVNTASFAGIFPYAASRIPYAAAKAAVISLSENLALHCEPQGIRVSCLIPGPVLTTIGSSMRNWSPELPMLGPGSRYAFMTAEAAAAKFADGIAAGQIMIASDDTVWDDVRAWASDPDAFIRARIAKAEQGEYGIPERPE